MIGCISHNHLERKNIHFYEAEPVDPQGLSVTQTVF